VEIEAMPGQHQHTLPSLVETCGVLAELGVPAVLLFGIPARKDAEGSAAWEADGIVQQALRAVRSELGDRVVLIGDVCLCEYTDHGHCGVIRGSAVDNDTTLEIYARIAVTYAEAGVDFVAPSGMMDGQVAAIRAALDSSGHQGTAILAYAAKYASALYGPFRDAVDVTIAGGGDRKGYQQDARNVREAIREVELDIQEGADMVMVKPALAYLDIIQRVRETFSVPVGAYNVSGEYAMVKAAAANGWIDEKRIALEILTGIYRAGASIILTYHAKDAARWLKNC
jgi:porphobilinogen synthase